MDILATATYEECRKYTGKLSIVSDDGKTSKVFLNVLVNSSEELQNILDGKLPLPGSVMCVTTTAVDGVEVHGGFSSDLFHMVSMEQALSGEVGTPDGFTTLVSVEEEFPNMRDVLSLSQKGYRFIGGNLLKFDGVNVGRYGKASGVAFCDVYDTFIESKLQDLGDIKEKMAKVRKTKKEGSSDSSERTKPSKSERLLSSFTNLFSSEEEVSF